VQGGAPTIADDDLGAIFDIEIENTAPARPAPASGARTAAKKAPRKPSAAKKSPAPRKKKLTRPKG